jgi:hypothetical protein
LVLRDIHLQPSGQSTPVFVQELFVYAIEGSPERPHRVHIRANGITSDLVGSLALLKSFGYEKLRADIGLDFELDDAVKEVQLNELSVRIEEVFAFQISYRVSDFEFSLDDFLTMPTFSPDIRIHHLRFAFQDLSLIAKLVAAFPGQAPDYLVNLLLARYPKFGEVAGFQEALEYFFNCSGTIVMIFSPPVPVTLRELQSSDDRTGLRFEYSQDSGKEGCAP